MARHDSGRIGRKHGLLSRLDRRPIRLSEDNADRHGRSPARGRKGSRAVLHAGEGRDKSPHPGKISLRGLRPSPESAPGVTRVHANAATALAPAFLDARCRNPDLGRPRAVFRCLSIRGRLMSLIKSISSMHRWRRTGGAVAAHSRSLHQESAQGGGWGMDSCHAFWRARPRSARLAGCHLPDRPGRPRSDASKDERFAPL